MFYVNTRKVVCDKDLMIRNRTPGGRLLLMLTLWGVKELGCELPESKGCVLSALGLTPGAQIKLEWPVYFRLS